MAEGKDLALGAVAPDFALPGIDGKTWRLADLRGPKGTVVMFLANHCPYVQAAIARIARDVAELEAHGVRSVAIMPNDTTTHPEDSLDNMTAFAKQHGFTFPYLIDETQDVARTYGAVCTPDFFGFDFDLKLMYHGRIDAGGKSASPGGRRELFEAMMQIAGAGKAPAEQHPSVGCSIAWRSQT
jgi:peroxiredoxin